jgi:Na+-transporting NADH:ubiquinone oxidoreductase subunit D
VRKFLTVLKEGMWTNNPIFVQVLGICSTLAVTNNMLNTMIMGVGVTFSTAFTSVTVSLLRNIIPRKVRMMVQVLLAAFYVIIVDITLRAYMPEVSKSLGPYVGLIITNCILMGRAEAYAQGNPPLISFWDGITNGAGYSAVLVVISVVRELLGFGTLFNVKVLPEAFPTWTIMVMAPSAFFLVASLLWLAKSVMMRKEAAK